MSDFNSFMSAQTSSYDKLRERANRTLNGERQVDPRFWVPDRGKDGNFYGVIRFMPATHPDKAPYARMVKYNFKGPGGWYIENSLSTVGRDDDPVDIIRRKLYNTGLKSDEDQAKKFRRKIRFVSNIQVIDDPKHPENNGKIFLYDYPKTIFEMINDKMNPPEEFKDEVGFDPFNFLTGANFVLKIYNKEEYPNYDKSEFKSPSALADGDMKKLQKIWESLYSLDEFTDPNNTNLFKTPQKLQERFNMVMGLDDGPIVARPVRSIAAETVEETPNKEPAVMVNDDGDEVDDELAFFKKQAGG